jgi:DNA-binding NarL/FixJ family response regulator
MIKIAIIEDDPELRKILSDHFQKSDRIECVMAVDTVEKFVKFHRDFLEIQLILLDVNLHNQSGIQGIPMIRLREPEAEIIMFTVMDDYDTIFNAICAGATGYLLKDLSPYELESRIVSVIEKGGALLSPMVAKKVLGYFEGKVPSNTMKGFPEPLSSKEFTIITFLKDGLTYEQIGQHLDITVNGVRYYVKGIYRKLQIKSRSELTRVYHKHI